MAAIPAALLRAREAREEVAAESVDATSEPASAPAEPASARVVDAAAAASDTTTIEVPDDQLGLF
jgi:hypothetical protein